MDKKNIDKILIISFGSMGSKYLNILLDHWPQLKIGVVTSRNDKTISIITSNQAPINNIIDKPEWRFYSFL